MAHRGVLFDFDGTLVRSMEDNFMAWQKALMSVSVSIKPEEYFPLEGTSVKKLAETYLKKAAQPNISAEDLVKKKEIFFKEIHRFSTYPGVDLVLDFLDSRQILFGIVTAGLRARLTDTVPRSFFDRFHTVITGEMTKFGKPYPDPYLAGAKALGFQPQDCIVVENSPLGIQAGKAAGCFCIAVCSTVDASKFNEADCVVNSFDELLSKGVIQKLLD